jgi:hypothetical protein
MNMSDIAAVRSNVVYKQIVQDLLIIDDERGYQGPSGTIIDGTYSSDLPRKPWHPEQNLAVSAETETALSAPRADVKAIKKGLLGRLNDNGRAVYRELQGKLTLPGGNRDLKFALCELDDAESDATATGADTAAVPTHIRGMRETADREVGPRI